MLTYYDFLNVSERLKNDFETYANQGYFDKNRDREAIRDCILAGLMVLESTKTGKVIILEYENLLKNPESFQ